MTRAFLRICALGALALAGCAPKTTPPAPVAPTVVPAAASGAPITLSVSPAPPRQLDTSTFTVVANNKKGEPMRDAMVTIDLVMPSMEMPENEVVCKQSKPGVYVGTGRFTMSGDWSARVTAQSGGLHSVQNFPLTVK